MIYPKMPYWFPRYFKHNYNVSEETISKQLKKGSDINASNCRGFTALHYAVRDGCIEDVELLIAHGATANTKNKYGWSPLHTAYKYGRYAIADLLIAHGADINAKNNKSVSILSYLIILGAPYVSTNYYHYYNFSETTGITDNYEFPQCFYSAIKRDLTVATLSKSCDIKITHKNREYVLHYRLFDKKCADTVKFLLQKGANVNAADITGDTSLHYFAKYISPQYNIRGISDIPLLKMLVFYRGEINYMNNEGKTFIDLLGDNSRDIKKDILCSVSKFIFTRKIRLIKLLQSKKCGIIVMELIINHLFKDNVNDKNINLALTVSSKYNDWSVKSEPYENQNLS